MSAGPKRLTGRKVLLITLLFFGVILAVNLTLMVAATGTFPGLVVKTPYVASQGWDRKTAASGRWAGRRRFPAAMARRGWR